MTSRIPAASALALALVLSGPAEAGYVNFESSHVHPISLTPSGGTLLAVNTPDAVLEVFSVGPGGSLTRRPPIPVGLEPVTVAARTDSEAWVVNNLSDSVSIVDLASGTSVRTLLVGDEPTDVVFAKGKAFVAVSREDAVKVFDLSDLAAPPLKIDLFGRGARALAVSKDGGKVYAIVLDSGNQTTVVNANVIAGNNAHLDPVRLAQLGLNTVTCAGPRPPYPPLPAGIERNPALTDPAPPAQPPVSLIVKWDGATNTWRDDAGQDWGSCVPYRLPDHDLFVIDASHPGPPAFVDHLGTTLFEVSVNPVSDKIYVPNTDARNFTRFEHPLGVQGHVVDDQLTVVDPASGNSVTRVDLNAHIDRSSNPATNLAEREASISQPGMMVWNAAGTKAYLTAIGSGKLFRVDGACLSGSCIFGSTRSAPDAVAVGAGPTGVALAEGNDKLYVLNRFSNSISLVRASTMTKLGEISLHDPSSQVVRDGRHLLYDAVSSSGHGDAACSSCHISGDLDGLAWDLGNPAGDASPYGTPGDNVRFIVPNPVTNQPAECPTPTTCSSHLGFDPQKGPMTTQTLRAMLEPLHWRGDRGTMNDFNPAFVSLLGAKDVGPVNGKPAGLSAGDMALFRAFALDIHLPPNPYRNVNDTLPNQVVSIPGHQQAGNPTAGQTIFLSTPVDGRNTSFHTTCISCHALPFGTAGGKLGGIGPADPSTARAALFNGNADESPHSDMKVPHLRNLYAKFGPRFGNPSNPADPPADQKSGFGFTHDGAVPGLDTFLSLDVFDLTAQQVRDVSVFLLHFPTEVKPAVGRHVTVPAGTPPTGTPEQETLVTTLISLGNRSDANRHCELVAAARGGGRERTWYLNGTSGPEGLWTGDVDGDAQVVTSTLRRDAGGPVTFTCATIDSGIRLGADRDLDGHFNGSDCEDGDPGHFAAPAEVTNVAADKSGPALLTWSDQTSAIGPALYYDVAGGSLSGLRSSGLGASTTCLAGGLAAASFNDSRPDPPSGDGYYYLVNARTAECAGGFGAGRSSIDALDCAGF